MGRGLRLKLNGPSPSLANGIFQTQKHRGAQPGDSLCKIQELCIARAQIFMGSQRGHLAGREIELAVNCRCAVVDHDAICTTQGRERAMFISLFCSEALEKSVCLIG